MDNFINIIKILWIVILLSSTTLLAEITLELNNDKPVVGETITATISIDVSGGENSTPQLTLSTEGLDIIEKGHTGESTESIYSNGKLTTRKLSVYTVILRANRSGRVAIKDIVADIGGGKLVKRDTFWFNVYSEKQEPLNIFLRAEPSKTKVFQNESILVRYYVYYRVDFQTFDIKEFPKLNGFTKRYLQEQGSRERVEVEGGIFIRQLLYSAIVFPQKPGRLQVDSMKVNISYSPDGGGRDFFGFGSSSDKIISKLFSSKIVEIDVLPIPGNSMPTGFTGLVGKHDFQLEINKTKLLINEPLEIKLKVSGVGNLEAMDAPQIINHPSFEDFENTSQFDINTNLTAIKTFQYTFLPRKSASIPAQKIPLSYFNASTGGFETVEVDLPAIEVVGNVATGNETEENKSQVTLQANNNDAINQVAQKLNLDIFKTQFEGPIFTYVNKDGNYLKQINFYLFIIFSLIILVAITLFKFKNQDYHRSNKYEVILHQIKNEGLSFAGIEKLLLNLPESFANKSIEEKIRLLKLEQPVENYFLELIKKLEVTFSANGLNNSLTGNLKRKTDYHFQEKYFKKLVKSLELTNDSH